MGTGTGVYVGFGVGTNVGVGIGVEVGVGTGVTVGTGVGVDEGVTVGVDVGTGVGVGNPSKIRLKSEMTVPLSKVLTLFDFTPFKTNSISSPRKLKSPGATTKLEYSFPSIKAG